MSPANVLHMELASALASRRTLVVRLGLPLLLGLPLVLADVPAAVRAPGLTMLVLFVSFFGAAVAASRRREAGLAERLRLLPLPPMLVRLDLVLAGAAVDAVQMAAVLALLVAVHGRGMGAADAAALAGTLVATLVALNAAGMALAAVARSNPEVHLLGALAVGIVAMAGGVIPVPAQLEGIVAATSPMNPVAALAAALARAAGDGPGPGEAWSVAGGAALALAGALLALRLANLPRMRPAPQATAR
jgi:ABC-type multidrug transport system permease subunit